ncbi:hypothetical protein CsSME_00028591 [Camellia sinensis var. sinensis]
MVNHPSNLCSPVVGDPKTCVPALLPPLKEIYPRNIVDDLIGTEPKVFKGKYVMRGVSPLVRLMRHGIKA